MRLSPWKDDKASQRDGQVNRAGDLNLAEREVEEEGKFVLDVQKFQDYLPCANQ